ncbi:TetR/AcrR family transcriptional regulator [Mycolicibacterium confluentis]|uniref:TetR family transcriptional regulator n=1 Tax=Mycolicibacterium confluentis TaxID=28047 RepID=A0A7I7XZY5_9MYCO|nr:TetR/AcrR family transcriptional regulator C-terminal domain-containing protein [Mycolicibacterium confluentis]MCV7319620.1 TetR/AcrR family transcriptional regulator [Mycolicibacterium confluentis]ORV34852.1 TetR family transcriptional regulator [Mycolicibacterium confluentis]BBZ34644.1 TetR family transcriptional regulator [Mycolicibacterium confluentis]
MTQQPTGGPSDGESSEALDRKNGQITRSLILRSALEIIDRDGVDALSMRRLSDAVNRDTTVLYRHLPNKAAVLDGVAEIVLSQLAVDTADRDWSGQLRAVAHRFRALALDHPKVVPLLVTRPLATPLGQRPPGTLRPLENILALLTSNGFASKDALRVYRVLFAYLHGHILTELQEVIERPEETDHVLQLGLHRLPITEFPHIRSVAPALATYDGAAELDRGLDLLLTGLTATLTYADGTSCTTTAALHDRSCESPELLRPR